MSKGWIKFYRSMFDNELWLAEPFTKGQAWVDLIGNANHKSASTWIRGIELRVERGQLAWSELTMAKRWQWSRGKVRRYLGTLKTKHMIVQQTNELTTLLTICNYEIYQGEVISDYASNGTANDTTGGTTDEHQTVHKQECNKNKNRITKDKDPVPAKAGTSKYSDEFEVVWQGRVKREGSDPKVGAYKKWKANIKRGVTAQEMTDGMARYKKFCEAKKSVGTEGVQMLQTFLGPNENYTQDWTVNQEVQANGKYYGPGGQGQKTDYNGDGWADGFDPTADPFADIVNGTGPANN